MKDEQLFKKNYNLYLKQQMMVTGVSVQELADAIGYSREGARQILKGVGSYRGVHKVCKALGVDMSTLLEDGILGK